MEDKNKRKIIIFQIFDNNCFFAVSRDGCKALPVRDCKDNLYHIPGSLELGDHQIIKSLVNQCIPLLRAEGECEKVILTSNTGTNHQLITDLDVNNRI
jgi:hypothetical protein